jgi:predicted esterase
MNPRLIGFALPLFASLAVPPARGSWGVAFPPTDTTEAHPPIVYLHGMWASPEDSCGFFAHAATPFGFLVCPRGNAPLGDGRMWKGGYSTAAPQVHAALEATGRQWAGKLDGTRGGTIMGYSNGAYFAAEIAASEPGKWTGLVLLSMRLELDLARLRAAGVRRVAFACGDQDAAREAMKALSDSTNAAGLPSRFVSLGPGGHELTTEMNAPLCDAVAWAREADPSRCAP